MPYTTAGKNTMLGALASAITHAGLFDADPGITGVTGVTSTDTFTKTAHGLANGNLVVLSALTGGAGLRTGFPYYVIASAANTFQLSETPGGTAVDLGTDVTAGTVTRLVELSGGSPAYARKAIAFAAAAGGLVDDSTNGAVFDVPAGASVDYAGFFSALTAGTLHALDDVVSESFAGQGTYTLTDAKLDLNA